MNKWWTSTAVRHTQLEVNKYFADYAKNNQFHLFILREPNKALRILLDDTPQVTISNLESIDTIADWVFQNLPPVFNRKNVFYLKSRHIAGDFYIGFHDTPLDLIEYLIKKGNFRFSIIVPSSGMVFTIFQLEYNHGIFLKLFSNDDLEVIHLESDGKS